MILKYHLSLPQGIYSCITLLQRHNNTTTTIIFHFVICPSSLECISAQYYHPSFKIYVWCCCGVAEKKDRKTTKYHQILLPKSTAMPCNLVEKNAHIWRPILSWGTSAKNEVNKRKSADVNYLWQRLMSLGPVYSEVLENLFIKARTTSRNIS